MYSLCMIGVAGQGLGLLAFPRRSREGGREYVIPLTNTLSVISVTDPRRNHELM